MDFDKIVLSKEELEIMKQLTKNEPLQLGKYSHNLEVLKFVNRRQMGINEYGTFQYDDFFFLSDLGKQYLAYNHSIRKASRGNWIRYWITTSIAIVALIKAFLPEIGVIAALLLKLLTQ